MWFVRFQREIWGSWHGKWYECFWFGEAKARICRVCPIAGEKCLLRRPALSRYCGTRRWPDFDQDPYPLKNPCGIWVICIWYVPFWILALSFYPFWAWKNLLDENFEEWNVLLHVRSTHSGPGCWFPIGDCPVGPFLGLPGPLLAIQIIHADFLFSAHSFILVLPIVMGSGVVSRTGEFLQGV